jgi:DNA-binding transcriptional regulator YhcF (GntR family)
MTVHDDRYFHSVAAAFDKDQIGLSGDARGRAVQPMSDGWRKYRRFHPGEPVVWVDDADGIPRGLTVRQYRVLTLALEVIDKRFPTMRAMALELNVAPSTVSRALTKLAAWGLIAYVVGRGRYAGMVIVRRVKGDGLERFRKAAKARVRKWYQYAKSRLEINVASMVPSTTYGVSKAVTVTGNDMNATLTTQRPWTVDELREAGII